MRLPIRPAQRCAGGYGWQATRAACAQDQSNINVKSTRRRFLGGSVAGLASGAVGALFAACAGARTEPVAGADVNATQAFALITPPPTTIAGATGRLNLPPDVLEDRHDRLIDVTGDVAELIAGWRRDQWTTNFETTLIPYAAIVQTKRERDATPPLDRPTFVSVTEAGAWLDRREPVIALEIDGDVRAYPLQIMTWHEVVNDVVAGAPVAVTFCPLSNSAMVFDRRVLGAILRFGVTGNVYQSDLLMWDNLTESWWQQLTGEAVVGDMAGVRLASLPSQLIAFDDFAAAFPGGLVLSRDTGFDRDYGCNPYPGYDTAGERPFLFRGETNPLLAPTARVVALSVGGEDVAYTFAFLRTVTVVNDSVGGLPVVVRWKPGTASALDADRIADGRDVGAGVVFGRRLGRRVLTFEAADGGVRDLETGSTWNIAGQAVAGPLRGQRLPHVPHANHFWFAWAAFKPTTKVKTRI